MTSWDEPFLIEDVQEENGSGLKATFIGTADVNDADGGLTQNKITIEVVDRGEPGVRDEIKVRYDATQVEGTVRNGNIQVQREKL